MKYLLFFSIALLSALATYKTFFMFKSDAVFAASIPFTNTVILLLIWAVSFSAKSDFVRKNVVILIVIPIMAIHFSNFITHLNHPMTDSTGLMLYVIASTSLVFFSYQSSVLESQLS